MVEEEKRRQKSYAKSTKVDNQKVAQKQSKQPLLHSYKELRTHVKPSDKFKQLKEAENAIPEKK